MRLVLLALGLLFALSGCARAPVAPVALPSSVCPGATIDVARADDDGTLDVHAPECRSLNSGGLLGEQAAIDALGGVAWPTNGPSVDRISVTVDRSADWSDPRVTVLAADQAIARWGHRAVIDKPFSPRALRAFVTAALWIGWFFGTVGLGVVVLVMLVRAGRRGDVVFVWWLR